MRTGILFVSKPTRSELAGSHPECITRDFFLFRIQASSSSIASASPSLAFFAAAAASAASSSGESLFEIVRDCERFDLREVTTVCLPGPSRAIKGDQGPSMEIKGHQGPSREIKGHQWRSRAIKGHQGRSRAINGDQGPSRAIKGHQGPSRAIAPSRDSISEGLRVYLDRRDGDRERRQVRSFGGCVRDHLFAQQLFSPREIRSDALSMRSACNQDAIRMQSDAPAFGPSRRS